MSLAWGIAPEQVGIGFDDLDEFGEIIDAVVREGRYCLFTGTEHGEASASGEDRVDVTCLAYSAGAGGDRL